MTLVDTSFHNPSPLQMQPIQEIETTTIQVKKILHNSELLKEFWKFWEGLKIDIPDIILKQSDDIDDDDINTPIISFTSTINLEHSKKSLLQRLFLQMRVNLLN